MSDELLDRLAAARPQPPADLLEPNHELLEEILMNQETKPKRARFAFAAAAAAAAVIGIAIAVPTHDSPKVTPTVAVNMRTIAESTSAALSSGRAHLTYSATNDGHGQDGGELTIDFSGENRSTVGTISARDATSFEIANKVVDGRFYLRDGAPGQQIWIEDTNEHITGSDLFSVDPRSLVTGAAQDAAFKDVGTATVDGVRTHHLKATRLDQVPTVNLGLGPISDDHTKLTKFDVWVDADNVVRRLDVSTSLTETVYPLARTVVDKDTNGTLQKHLDESNMGPSEERTTVNDYSVIFTDIGSPIAIDAPANARKVAGQG